MTARKLGEMLISAESGRITQIDADKVSRGAFFTTDAAWLTAPVREFIAANLGKAAKSVLDPFAGDGHLLELCSREFGCAVSGLDISGEQWPKNDSLLAIDNPAGAMIVTNPPYLANYSAKRKGVDSQVAQHFLASKHDNLYKLALERCLEAADYVVAIIPETFLQSEIASNRLSLVSVIEQPLFSDTDAPALVAAFGKDPVAPEQVAIYLGDRLVSNLARLRNLRAKQAGRSGRIRVIFNEPTGRIGLRAVDGTSGQAPIRFMPAGEFDYPASRIKVSSRLMTYIEVPAVSDSELAEVVTRANAELAKLRADSCDLVLAPFKGNDKTGKRRRRLDYAQARNLLEKAVLSLEK